MFLVQMDTMKCYYCPQKGASVVPWDSLLPADQTFLRDKHPDVGEGAACNLCVRSARPGPFFARPALQSTAISSAAHQCNDCMHCRPCCKKVHYTREDTITRHVTCDTHDIQAAKQIRVGAKLVLAPGYKQREEHRKAQEKEKKARNEENRKQEYTAERWRKDREKKYRKEMDELQRGRPHIFCEEKPVSLPAELGNQPLGTEQIVAVLVERFWTFGHLNTVTNNGESLRRRTTEPTHKIWMKEFKRGLQLACDLCC